MIRIAIVDDEKEQIQFLLKITTDFFINKNIQISVDTFTSGEKLLSATVSYDLIFLDIQMDGIDGIETAQQLRVRNKKASLFYITSYENYIKRSMTIHPFAFIVKSFSDKEIRKNLEDYLQYINSLDENQSKELFQIHTLDGRNFHVNMDDIFYFHYLENRTIEIIMEKDKYKIKDSITNIYPMLNHEYFIIPHQSFIVNLHYIKEIDGKNKKLVLKNGDLVLIPRRKYNEVIEVLNRYIAVDGR